MSLKYNKTLIQRAKELRHNMTPQERLLWHLFLKQHPIRFQRQKVIDNYIVDFYCHRAKVVIEIDGSQHYSDDGRCYDSEREKVLANYGLYTIRIANNDVNLRFREVCQHIDDFVRERIFT